MLFRRKSSIVAAPAPAIAPMAYDAEPDLRGLGRILWQKKTRILGLTLLAGGVAFLVVNAITPRYQSESRLLLEARENVFLRAEADKTGERTTIDPEAVTSQIQLVLSRDLARDVIKKEKLADNPEFDPSNNGLAVVRSILGKLGIGRDISTMSPEERTLEAYYDRLNVYAVEKSRVIAVDFSSANPDLAAQVANTIASTYLSTQQAVKQDQTRAAGNWLAGEIEKMRARVAEAEAKVEEYRTRENLFSGSNNTSLPSQQLTEINSQIAAARGQKADVEARARQLRDLMNSGKSINSADIANTDTMRRLIEQRIAVRAQLAEQSTTLLDQHPRIKELKSQVAEIDRQIQVEGERLLRQLDNDASVARDRLAALGANLEQVKKAASQTSEQDVQLRALEREAKTQRDLLELLSREISRSHGARQHQCGAAGRAHHFARHACDEAGLPKEAADRADCRLRSFRAVGRLHGDGCAAGGTPGLWLFAVIRSDTGHAACAGKPIIAASPLAASSLAASSLAGSPLAAFVAGSGAGTRRNGAASGCQYGRKDCA